MKERVGRRVFGAMLVGAILPTALLVWAYAMTKVLPDRMLCGGHFGCLDILVYVWEVGRWVAIVLAWPLLYVLRVRPAWPVAVAGGLFLVAIWEFALSSVAPPGIVINLIVLSALIAYSCAVLVASPELARPWRAAIAAAFLALYLLGLLL
ncbi:hypothetical protein ACFYSC_06430 [Streptosporangium sp. NPDC004379]|uniref:hypothetical protein n=1 Tax=Streptosporangium sp. NPDC004379 TaxID=3366189 RepID=UPI003692D314